MAAHRIKAEEDNGEKEVAPPHHPVEPQWENTIPDELVDHPLILACQESDCSFLVTNPRLPGNPIIYINSGFLDMTGYPQNKILGRNCRFMQGPETDPVVVARLREAVDEGRNITVTLLNYRADSSTFYNRIIISPVKDANDDLLYFLGVTEEVSMPLPEERLIPVLPDEEENYL